jgi:polysaccharide export outer membrane protein
MNFTAPARRHCSSPLMLFGLLIWAAAASAQPGDYLIGKGDQLLITVWGFPEFTTSATVREDGALALPLAGDIPAAGLRRPEFVSALKKRLGEFIQGEINVTVSVLSSSLQRISVLGAVTRPDTYPFTGETSLLAVLGAAGGPAPDANLRKVQIFRKDPAQENTVVDLERFMERADIDNLPLVKPGDVIFVPREKNFLKEFGEYMGYVVVFFALLRVTEGGGN